MIQTGPSQGGKGMDFTYIYTYEKVLTIIIIGKWKESNHNENQCKLIRTTKIKYNENEN